jgi:hypothetical protein
MIKSNLNTKIYFLVLWAVISLMVAERHCLLMNGNLDAIILSSWYGSTIK